MIIGVDEYTQEIKASLLKVKCEDINVIYMSQCINELYEVLDKKEIADTLNIYEDEIMDDITVQIVPTGLMDILNMRRIYKTM